AANAALIAGTMAWIGGYAGLPLPFLSSLAAALVAFVVVGTAATRIGRARKGELGVAEPNRGRRSAAHALANAAFGAVAALAVPLAGWPRLVSVAAFATAASDTLATEVGQLGRARPWSLVSGRRVSVGTPGAVSALGVLAGVAGACAVGTVAVALGAIRPSTLPAVVGGSVVGTTVESLLAAAGAPLGHHARNLLNTAVGAGAAIALGGAH
ncbi:MAG: DUF92 domain-containing protein, partial [Gemmatimonadetes bacterium]|nr:DUF92 domain-containing protein [Gemmatimonadota bacterium]